MSFWLLLWQGFKPSHIIRESRVSLLCLWGFPSRLYNDLPVGLFSCWRHSLLTRPSLARLQSKQNPLCPRLCFWHQLFVHDSSSWLLCFTYSQLLFLHHLFSSLMCFSGLLLPLSCLSLSFPLYPHFYWHFFQLLPQAFSPHCLQKRLLGPWCMRAADAHLLPSSQSGGCF